MDRQKELIRKIFRELHLGDEPAQVKATIEVAFGVVELIGRFGFGRKHKYFETLQSETEQLCDETVDAATKLVELLKRRKVIIQMKTREADGTEGAVAAVIGVARPDGLVEQLEALVAGIMCDLVSCKVEPEGLVELTRHGPLPPLRIPRHRPMNFTQRGFLRRLAKAYEAHTGKKPTRRGSFGRLAHAAFELGGMHLSEDGVSTAIRRALNHGQKVATSY